MKATCLIGDKDFETAKAVGIADANYWICEQCKADTALAAKDAEIERLKRFSRHPDDIIMLNQQQTKLIEQAQVMAAKDAEIERLRKALGECLDEFAHRAFDSPQASHRGNAEMMKVCGSALGEAGKKEPEPETCVWTELENGRLRGCNGNRFGNELGRSKFCPECGRKVEVWG